MLFSKEQLNAILQNSNHSPELKSLANCCLQAYNLLETESADIAKVLYNYLTACGERCEIVRMCGNIFLSFSNGFKSKDIENKLKPLFQSDSDNTLLVYPIPITSLIEIGDIIYG